MMKTLGIETSCDETSASVTEGKRVLSCVISSSVEMHKKYGGVVPEIASRYHVEYIVEVVDRALRASKKRLGDIALISVTNGPGLVGALLTGISFAKALSLARQKPIIGVNHVLAHLYSAFLDESISPRFPFVGLVVSGGHTALFFCEEMGRQKVLGQTLDDAVGEAFDKVAKTLGLGYPGGPAIEARAARARKKGSVRFPKTNVGKDSLDFSFSGLKTAVLYYVRDRQASVQRKSVKSRAHYLTSEEINDICYAFQENAIDALIEKTFDAVRRYGAREVVVGGGVAINARLREKFRAAAVFRGGVTIHFPLPRHCLDNAAMVGFLGEEMYRQGKRSDVYLSAEPNLEVL